MISAKAICSIMFPMPRTLFLLPDEEGEYSTSCRHRKKNMNVLRFGGFFFSPSSSLTEVCPAQVRQSQHFKRQVKCHKSPRSSGMAAQTLAAGNINHLLFVPYSSFPRSQPTEQGGNFKQRHRRPTPAPGSGMLGAG